MQRGLFLDLDGTLAKSLDFMIQVYYDFLKSYGRTGSSAEFDTLNGVPFDKVIEMMKATHSIEDSTENMRSRFKQAVEQAYLSVEISEGAERIIDRAKANGWKIAIVTSNSEAIVKKWLNKVGLTDRVDCLVTQNSITKGKPHPEPYLLALSQTSSDPRSSIALEDSQNGIESAISAGIRTFAYAHKGTTLSHEKLAGTIRHFSELESFL